MLPKPSSSSTTEHLNRRGFVAATAALMCGARFMDQPPSVLWQIELKSPCYGGGALGELAGQKAIVFGTYYNDEHLYAVRAKDGQVLWKFKSEAGPFDASVAIADVDGDKENEVLAADSSTGTLFCLDGAGKLKWKFRLPSSTDSPPSIADIDGDGRPEIVVGTMTADQKLGQVVAVNPRTQKTRWAAKVPGHVQSEPALIDLRGSGALDVVVTNWRGDKTVRAFRGQDGSALWSHEMKGDMYHGVAAANCDGVKLLAASIAGDIALLDGAGKVIWTKQPGGYLFGPASAADVDGDGRPEWVVCGGRIHVFDGDGNQRWQSPDFQSVPRGVAIAEWNGSPTLFFGASDRRFRGLDGRTGKEQFHFDATVKGHVYEGIDCGPIVADIDGHGQLMAFFVVGNGTSDQTKSENYGRGYAIRLGAGRGIWPMFRGNLRRTGSA